MSSTYTALLSALADQLKQVSTANPFAINLADAIPILSFIGTLTGIWLLGLVYFSKKDREERKDIMKSAWDPAIEPIHSSEFLKNGFPKMVTESDDRSLFYRILDVVIAEHALTNFVTGGASLIKSRLNRWLDCWYNIMVMLFIDSLFYGINYSLTHSLTHPPTHTSVYSSGVFFSDTGLCESLVIEDLCLSLENDIFHKPQCTWTPSTKSATGGYCALAPPPNDYLFFAVLSIIISAIGVLFSIMFKILAVYIMACQPDWERLPFYNFVSCIFHDPYHVDSADKGSSKMVKKTFVINKRNKKIGEIENDIEEVHKSLDILLWSYVHSPAHSLVYSPTRSPIHSLVYSPTHSFTYYQAYYDCFTPHEEAMSILRHMQSEFSQRQKQQGSAQRTHWNMMHRNSVVENPDNTSPVKRVTHDSSPSYPLLHELVAVNPNGTLAPLSLIQSMYYGSAFDKLVHKLSRVHYEAEQLEKSLGTRLLLHPSMICLLIYFVQ